MGVKEELSRGQAIGPVTPHAIIPLMDFSRYIDVWSDVRTPSQVRLHRADGRELRVIDANKVASLAEYRLATPEFLRLRVGVGRPGRGDPRQPADYVLSNFEPEEDRDNLVARAADAVETLDAEGLERTQAQYN